MKQTFHNRRAFKNLLINFWLMTRAGGGMQWDGATLATTCPPPPLGNWRLLRRRARACARTHPLRCTPTSPNERWEVITRGGSHEQPAESFPRPMVQDAAKVTIAISHTGKESLLMQYECICFIASTCQGIAPRLCPERVNYEESGVF